jgi:hypothetical protein
MFLRNINKLLPDYTASYQKITLFIILCDMAILIIFGEGTNYNAPRDVIFSRFLLL